MFDGAAQQLPSKTFVAVQDRRYIASWDESDVKLQKMVRRSWEDLGDIMSVVVDRKLEAQAILTFSTGSVALWNPGNPKLAQTIKLVDEGYIPISSAHSKRTQNDISLFILAAKDSLVSGSYSLFSASCVHSTHEGAALKRHSAGHQLATVRPDHVITNFVFESAGQFLTVLWDDGLLEIYQIPGGIQGLSTANTMNLQHSLALNVYTSAEAQKALRRKDKKKGQSKAADVTFHNFRASGNALVGISEGHVVIGGRKTSESSESDDSQNYLLTAWDLRYGLVQLQKDLDLVDILENKTSTSLPSRESTKALKRNPSQLPARLLRQAVFSTDRNAVLLNFGEVVLVCPIFVAPSSLAQALGSQAATKQLLAPSTKPVTLSQQYDYLSQSIAPLKSKRNGAGFLAVTQSDFAGVVSDSISHEAEAIAQLSDRSKTPDYNTFMEVFNEYVTEVSKHAQNGALTAEIDISILASEASNARKKWKNLQEYTEHENLQKEKKMVRSRLTHQIDFSPAFIQAVVARCLSEDYLWLPLKRLIESRCVSIKLNPTLLTVLKAKKRLDLISAALNFVSDISELEVVGIVRYLVNDIDQASMQIFIDEHQHHRNTSSSMELSLPESSSTDSSWQSPLDRFLNIVVNMSLDSLFLQYCLQLFSLREMVAMLRYLLTWFEHSSEFADHSPNDPTDYFAPLPPLGRVVAWANAIIDSHLTELILVPDCARLLRRLHDAISHTIDVCDSMQVLRGCLVNYFDHDPTPRDSGSDYSIELLRL